ncbi:hypothetical protein PPTG_11796 [Phytophthora nicotianae INRA-310]|uniref:Uncharacterized protein n=2 Tax=Phytophthora nicotianae TaxID=4792 RepID=W2Q888_PHYN3|nr:hypothetical protein PPTG_11796 [Phytophthora nicotianae INRA-310]ETN09383.1 hypothetical protein PPTG_11796 [Phytophthora nicotianae INRA-310]
MNFGIPCTPTRYEIAFNDSDDEDDTMDFGIPCTPTRYEIAFNDSDDEDDTEDTDADIFVGDGIVSTAPMNRHQRSAVSFQPTRFYKSLV